MNSDIPEKHEPPVNLRRGSASPGFSDEILTKKKLSERLHVTVRTIENWQRRGVLQYIKVGKVVLFVWGDVLESLRNFKVSRRTAIT